MDPLASLLDGLRARGAFVQRSILDPPWSVRIQDEALVCVVTVVRGAAWAIPHRGEAVRLGRGDVAVMRGPDPYTFADHPESPVQVVIHPGRRRTTPGGAALGQDMELGPRTWGTSPGGSTTLVIGKYQRPDEVGWGLLRVLPPLLVLNAAAWHSASLGDVLAHEVARQGPGQDAVLDRLVDLLLADVLRTWFARPGEDPPVWYRAHSDPVIGPALVLLHSDPARPWTVGALAAKIGVSRAALARRFIDLVGEPPMKHLTSWRMSTAARLLREPGSTLESVARQVGYGSASAFSTAFKRVHGISPQQYRTGD
ncbi:AraC family transcriptional regulator [Streptomyces smyrnaeus]|uniref:AraC family transcriptional regulator n=1 Tax=Streptomyces smyrnaeus TaxID=1387713 RepID=UPI00339E34D5